MTRATRVLLCFGMVAVLYGISGRAHQAEMLPCSVPPFGQIERYGTELDRTKPPHGINVVMDPNAFTISSDYNSRYGYCGFVRAGYAHLSPRHTGIDIKAPKGTPVIAAAPGKVIQSHTTFGGERILINHGGGLSTSYTHLDRRLVIDKITVKRGQVIGLVGDTGKPLNVYPGDHHVHFAVRQNGLIVNPHGKWADGEGIVTLFDANRAYPADRLTYPLPSGADVEKYRFMIRKF